MNDLSEGTSIPAPSHSDPGRRTGVLEELDKAIQAAVTVPIDPGNPTKERWVWLRSSAAADLLAEMRLLRALVGEVKLWVESELMEGESLAQFTQRQEIFLTNIKTFLRMWEGTPL